MAKKIVKQTLDNFLFNQIANDPEFYEWQQHFELPKSFENLKNPLRAYQIRAIENFIYTLEKNGVGFDRHLLFNMATGTGKTLTMAAIVLYLYELGYRNFIFLVNQINIKEQAKGNLTDYKFEKFLFKDDIITINNQKVKIKAIERFEDADKNGINFLFISTQMLSERITIPKENSISIENFQKNLTVILADEAHHLNSATKKQEQESEKNWESAVQAVLAANPKNLLLEFTATVDFRNNAIAKKYQDKLIYRYSFAQFNNDKYSKNVKFLFSEETHIKDQKRLLIVNAVALSEYRRLFALKEMGLIISPVILAKSKTIDSSKEDREFFHKVIGSLNIDDFNDLKNIKNQPKSDLFSDNSILIIEQLFGWIRHNLSSPHDKDGLYTFINEIKQSFAENHTFVYHSKDKSKANELLHLDSQTNHIRTIFYVNALNEGWDVLGLYDIIHFDISSSKKVSLQDIQLIGRGARLKPYELPKSHYKTDTLLDSLDGKIHFEKYQRKFDDYPNHPAVVLETFFYHFVKTGVFLDELIKELQDEGIINDERQKRTFKLKEHFIQSDTYQNGFVLVNNPKFRNKITTDDMEKTFNRTIQARSYTLRQKELSDKQNNEKIANTKSNTIYLKEPYFSYELLRKALSIAENGFFRFDNLVQHIYNLDSIDTFILDTKYLPTYQIDYAYEMGKEIENLTPNEKLQLLLGGILPEVRKLIDRHLAIMVGDSVFKPIPLKDVFQKQKHIYIAKNNDGHKGIAQSNEISELSLDISQKEWYAYSENYGTSEEKRFVKYIATQIDDLKQKYPEAEIYLIRNELDYYLFNIEDGRRFSPDYMMIINDIINQKVYYQCLFEPKGGHLLQKDEWKEKALIALNDSTICFDDAVLDNEQYRQYLTDIKNYGYQEIKCLGFKFFNSDVRGESDFGVDFNNKL